MYLLMLITAIIIAGLMGVRFGSGGFMEVLTDYRVFVAAVVSIVLWTFIGTLFSAFGKKDEKENKEWGGEDEKA